MECTAEREIVRPRTDNEPGSFFVSAVFPAVLCFVGAVTGTIVFSRAYSDGDAAAFIDAHRALPTVFVDYFVYSLLAELPYFAGLIISALFVPGFLAAPAALFLGGLRLGVSVCCFYSGCGLWGILYVVPVIAVPAVCVMVSRAVLCHGSMLLSLQLFRSLINYGGAGKAAGKLIISIPLCAALDLFAAAFAAFMRTIMYRFIS